MKCPTGTMGPFPPAPFLGKEVTSLLALRARSIDCQFGAAAGHADQAP
jgi:hypothetical protein